MSDMASDSPGNSNERVGGAGSGLIGYFANNHVAVNVLMLLLVGIGCTRPISCRRSGFRPSTRAP